MEGARVHVSVETLCNLFKQASQAYICGDSSVLCRKHGCYFKMHMYDLLIGSASFVHLQSLIR